LPQRRAVDAVVDDGTARLIGVNWGQVPIVPIVSFTLMVDFLL
jgi:hypothetical protein